jgi:hypothetical protein
MTARLEARHSLIRGLREGRSETELTRAIAAVLAAEPKLASEFVRLTVAAAPRAANAQPRPRRDRRCITRGRSALAVSANSRRRPVQDAFQESEPLDR